MRKNILLALFILMSLYSCTTSGAETTGTDDVILEPSLAETQTMTTNSTGTPLPPTQAIIPEGSSLPNPTETASEIPTLTPTGNPAITYRCLKPVAELPSDILTQNPIVLSSRVPREGIDLGNDTFLLELASGNQIQIAMPNEVQLHLKVSPNRQFLVFKSIFYAQDGAIIDSEISVATAVGNRISTISYEEGWVYLVGWLNDQQVIIDISGLDSEEAQGLKPATLLALNPFTGERVVLSPEYPDMYEWHPLPFWEGWSFTVYDPTLSRVIYPRFTGSGHDYSYAIWDMETNQLLASLEELFIANTDLFPFPRWSADGSKFVSEGFAQNPPGFELFQVTRDGQVEQLTNLFSYDKSRLVSYSWSPNGEIVAAWLRNDELEAAKEVELVMIDTISQEVTSYCLKIKYGGEKYEDTPGAPIWSPDGTQLVAMDWYEQDKRRVFLIDLEGLIYGQIAEDMVPVGWMEAP